MNKKILIITTVSGFLQKFEAGNVRLLQEMGYEVHYAANAEIPVYQDAQNAETPAFSPGVIFHDICISKSPFDFSANKKALFKVCEIIKDKGITAIHCHTPVGGMIGRLAGRRCSVKVIYTAHGFHFYKGAPALHNFIYRNIEKYLARFTDAIVVINREDYDAALKFKLRTGGEVYQIPGAGLDLEKFPPASEDERRSARERLGIRADEILLLSVGELNKNKNHETVIKALEFFPEIKYIICGEGPCHEQLQQLIDESGLSDKVTLAGYCCPVRDYLAAADIFAFPSRREGLGMAALEALSMGIPVIAADNRGTREYMKDGENGYVSKWDDPGEYAAALKKFEALSQEELEQIKQNCRKGSAGFSRENTCNIMRKVYKNHLQ